MVKNYEFDEGGQFYLVDKKWPWLLSNLRGHALLTWYGRVIF